jgi:hypothetical protein
LLNELRITPKDFNNYLGMNENTYLHLLSLVIPLIQKQNEFKLHYITLLYYIFIKLHYFVLYHSNVLLIVIVTNVRLLFL